MASKQISELISAGSLNNVDLMVAQQVGGCVKLSLDALSNFIISQSGRGFASQTITTDTVIADPMLAKDYLYYANPASEDIDFTIPYTGPNIPSAGTRVWVFNASSNYSVTVVFGASSSLVVLPGFSLALFWAGSEWRSLWGNSQAQVFSISGAGTLSELPAMWNYFEYTGGTDTTYVLPYFGSGVTPKTLTTLYLENTGAGNWTVQYGPVNLQILAPGQKSIMVWTGTNWDVVYTDARWEGRLLALEAFQASATSALLSLDSRATALEAKTMETFFYGVNSVFPSLTIFSQFATIAGHVTSRNKASSSYSKIGMVAAGTPTLTVTATGGAPVSVCLPNGKVLIAGKATSTVYNLYLYDPETNSIGSAVTTITVTTASAVLDMVALPNGQVLILTMATGARYNLRLFDPETNTATDRGDIIVTSSSTGRMKLLPNGKVLIVVYASSTTWNLYTYAYGTDTLAAASGTPTITVSNASFGAPCISSLTNGNALVGVASGPTTIDFYRYVRTTETATPIATPQITVGTSGHADTALLPDGRVLVAIQSETTAYALYLYDSGANAIAASVGAPSITVTTSLNPRLLLLPNGNVLFVGKTTNNTYAVYLYDPVADTLSSLIQGLTVSTAARVELRLLPNGKVLCGVYASTTTYAFYLGTGPFNYPNRYQFPSELLFSGMV